MEPQAISSDLIRGHIDTIILHTLLDGDKFAQQISDAVEEKSEKEYKINQATLYSSLKRLEVLKHVTSYWNDSDGGGRRKFFKLTDSGRATVENNLSSWSYSRAIIDKLMDCSPQPIFKTQYVEKIVEVPVEVPIIKEVEVVKEIPQVIPEVTNEVKPKATPSTNQQENVKTDDSQSAENNQEINFRNILNGLIKTVIQQKTQGTELEPLDKTPETIDEAPAMPKFNETISETDYNAERSNNGKIDFGDLTLKAAKEGYKIRISSKDSYSSTGTLLVNKLNLFSACSIYLLTMIQFLVYVLIHGTVLNASLPVTLALIACFTAFPVVVLVGFVKNPMKNSAKKISADSILTAAIIVFNLMLINLAAALLFNLDFSSSYNSLVFVAIPLTLYGNVFIYYLVKYFYSKSNLFYSKRKKTA